MDKIPPFDGQGLCEEREAGVNKERRLNEFDVTRRTGSGAVTCKT
jgi:hypothetical protein